MSNDLIEHVASLFISRSFVVLRMEKHFLSFELHFKCFPVYRSEKWINYDVFSLKHQIKSMRCLRLHRVKLNQSSCWRRRYKWKLTKEYQKYAIWSSLKTALGFEPRTFLGFKLNCFGNLTIPFWIYQNPISIQAPTSGAETIFSKGVGWGGGAEAAVLLSARKYVYFVPGVKR